MLFRWATWCYCVCYDMVVALGRGFIEPRYTRSGWIRVESVSQRWFLHKCVWFSYDPSYLSLYAAGTRFSKLLGVEEGACPPPSNKSRCISNSRATQIFFHFTIPSPSQLPCNRTDHVNRHECGAASGLLTVRVGPRIAPLVSVIPGLLFSSPNFVLLSYWKGGDSKTL